MRLEKSTIDSTKKNLRDFLSKYSGERIPLHASRDQGIDPTTTDGYLQKSFPHIFPRGEIRLDNKERDVQISEIELIKHLISLKDQRFSRDQVLPYVLMDLKNRFQTKKLTRFFMMTNPVEATMSPEQLNEMPENELIKKLYPCLHPVLGSMGYYKDKRKKLR